MRKEAITHAQPECPHCNGALSIGVYCGKCNPPTQPNAELLRLLERHHAAWVARDLSSAKDVPYGGTPLCMETGDAIERAEEKV